MKKTLTAFLPALALLTLGSCAGTSYLASTEDDGVYYSSKDRTTQNATASTATTAARPDADAAGSGADEATNPEYRSGSSSSSGSGSSSEYYDDDYSYAARIRRFNQPVYRGFGYGYYDLVYTDPFWYGGGYSPYGWGPGYYGAYYDPFYSPYAYGGSFINISIGFGRPYYYNPWRYGYGYGYGGFGGYGYGGYSYGGYYDGYRNGYYHGLSYGYGGRGTKVNYGPRRDGARDAMSASATQPTGGRGRGRIDEGGVANPGGRSDNGGQPSGGFSNAGNGSGQPQVLPGRGRGRIVENAGSVTPTDAPVRQPMTGRDLTDQPVKDRESRMGQLGTEAEQPRLDTQPSRGRWRVVDNGNAGGGSPATPQDYAQPRRGRYQDVQPAGAGGADTQPERRVRQRQYSEYSQPSQQVEQPARQRSYSEPSRSYSPGNFGGGGNSGGGNSGGGGGSRGRGRMQ